MVTLFNRLFQRPQPASLASVTVRVDDSPGWSPLTARPHDYDAAQVQENYQDALTAWRKNPIAWRIIAITTSYTVGDNFNLSSTHRALNTFIRRFWDHPKNNMALRLEAMSDELARSGDLFVLLFRNPQDGMSYIRFITKDRIARIETAPNDWETELSYIESLEDGAERAWLSALHPAAPESEAVMLHYAVNRPIGALLGESDLQTMIPWLLRYGRMLEDRVRLHWAARAFLWMVTVPANRVKEKQEQYRTPPEAGSVIIKDESEQWDVKAPLLHGTDAAKDLQAVRQMIDAGSGYPPHWRGESGDANLATATAMQAPTERHLLRRQRYFIYMLQDILYHAYQRAWQIGAARPLPTSDYEQLFTALTPDISRSDNQSLALAARDITQAFHALVNSLPAMPPSLARLALRAAFKFAGENLSESHIDDILAEQAAMIKSN